MTANDDARRDALADRLFGAFIGGAELLTIELGRRLGLYETIDRLGTVTSGDLAAGSGIAERYAREWLEQQAAAGILDVREDSSDALTRRFELPAGHVSVLLDPEHPANMMAMAPFLTGFALTLPAVSLAYRTGVGVAFEQFGSEVRHGIGGGNRPMFATSLPGWIEALPDVAERLRSGGAVLDLGCGTGYSSMALAKAFERIRVDGIDLDAASIADARSLVAEAGLADRVQFRCSNASDQTERPESTALPAGDDGRIDDNGERHRPAGPDGPPLGGHSGFCGHRTADRQRALAVLPAGPRRLSVPAPDG